MLLVWIKCWLNSLTLSGVLLCASPSLPGIYPQYCSANFSPFFHDDNTSPSPFQMMLWGIITQSIPDDALRHHHPVHSRWCFEASSPSPFMLWGIITQSIPDDALRHHHPVHSRWCFEASSPSPFQMMLWGIITQSIPDDALRHHHPVHSRWCFEALFGYLYTCYLDNNYYYDDTDTVSFTKPPYWCKT